MGREDISILRAIIRQEGHGSMWGTKGGSNGPWGLWNSGRHTKGALDPQCGHRVLWNPGAQWDRPGDPKWPRGVGSGIPTVLSRIPMVLLRFFLKGICIALRYPTVLIFQIRFVFSIFVCFSVISMVLIHISSTVPIFYDFVHFILYLSKNS